MRSYFRSLKFAWEYWVRKQHRRAPLSDLGCPPVNAKLMEFLADMYESHGASACRVENWVAVGDAILLTRGSTHEFSRPRDSIVLRVDFVTLYQGRLIIEAFAGVGKSHTEALEDACRSFQDCTFHALFSTLLGKPPCQHADTDVWTIDGWPRRVTLGLMRYRGSFPCEQWEALFSGIQLFIENAGIERGLHWIRLFYSRAPHAETTVEALLDNEPDEKLEAGLGGLPWPEAEAFYSVRLFMVIQDMEES